MLPNKLKELRSTTNFTQSEFAKKIDVARTTYAMYEQGHREPDYSTLQKIADFYGVTTDYLLGRANKKGSEWDSSLPELNEKDERDIAKDLEDMLNNLNSEDGYAAFDGRSMEDMDEEDKELLIASLENSLRLAKRMAKQKFTPKKYRE